MPSCQRIPPVPVAGAPVSAGAGQDGWPFSTPYHVVALDLQANQHVPEAERVAIVTPLPPTPTLTCAALVDAADVKSTPEPAPMRAAASRFP